MLTNPGLAEPRVAIPTIRRPGRIASQTRWFYAFISPWLIGLIVMFLGPMIIGILLSFTNYNGLNPDSARFIGLNNYARAIADPNVTQALGRTTTFALFFIPLNIAIGLILAVLLNLQGRARTIFRTLLYLPSVVPVVGAVLIWKSLWDQNYGLINGVLYNINPGLAVPWLATNPTGVLLTLSLWLAVGSSMIIYLAALQSIPKELDEAARVDGANFFLRLRHIVWPLLTPVIFYQLIVSLIYSLQVLVEPLLLAPSGLGSYGAQAATVPADNTVFMVYIYQQMFGAQRFGYAASLLVLLLILTVSVTAIIFATRRFWVYSESGNV